MPRSVKNGAIVVHATSDLEGGCAARWSSSAVCVLAGGNYYGFWDGPLSLTINNAAVGSFNKPGSTERFIKLECIDGNVKVYTSSDGSAWTLRISVTGATNQSAGDWRIYDTLLAGAHEESFVSLDSSGTSKASPFGNINALGRRLMA